MTLREKLIVLRDKAGISQISLAERLDVSRQAISRWESGAAAPSTDKLKALAKIYGVSLDWLCDDAADMASLNALKQEPTEEPASAAAANAKEPKTRKFRYIAIAFAVSAAVLLCAWFTTKKGNDETGSTQIGDLARDEIEIPVGNEFDFEWKE